VVPANKHILFLIQGSHRSIYFESFVFELQKKGYTVIIGSMCVPGALQAYFQEKGFICESYDVPRNPLPLYYYKHAKFWKKIIARYDIKAVYAHLQWANFVALLLNTFTTKKIAVIPTRHHVDASFLYHSKKRKIEDAIINLFAKKQVVVSLHAKQFMLRHEWFAREDHIYFIPLGYDFNLYKGLELNQSDAIRKEFPAKLLLLIAARLVKTKRHELLLDAMKVLLDKGLDIKLMVLDDGPEKDHLERKVKDLGLEARVSLLGNKVNISDYMIAADMLVQPSVEESSNQVLKEAAYYNKTAIVTKGIGDFDEYIADKTNAFLIEKETTAAELAALIEEVYAGRYDLEKMAETLKHDVITRFDIVHTVNEYLKLSNI
jgi:glycosyltransferase involved in cell wall biosynthesis